MSRHSTGFVGVPHPNALMDDHILLTFIGAAIVLALVAAYRLIRWWWRGRRRRR